jgi:hypothetical protein
MVVKLMSEHTSHQLIITIQPQGVSPRGWETPIFSAENLKMEKVKQ